MGSGPQVPGAALGTMGPARRRRPARRSGREALAAAALALALALLGTEGGHAARALLPAPSAPLASLRAARGGALARRASYRSFEDDGATGLGDPQPSRGLRPGTRQPREGRPFRDGSRSEDGRGSRGGGRPARQEGGPRRGARPSPERSGGGWEDARRGRGSWQDRGGREDDRGGRGGWQERGGREDDRGGRGGWQDSGGRQDDLGGGGGWQDSRRDRYASGDAGRSGSSWQDSGRDSVRDSGRDRGGWENSARDRYASGDAGIGRDNWQADRRGRRGKDNWQDTGRDRPRWDREDSGARSWEQDRWEVGRGASSGRQARPRPTSDYVATEERRESWRPPLWRPATHKNGVPIKGQGPPPARAPPPARDRTLTIEPIRLPIIIPGVKLNLYQLKPKELELWVSEELGLPKFRAGQIQKWLHDKGVDKFDDMHSLPNQLKLDLEEIASIGATDWKVLAERESTDGTIKRAYGVPGKGDHAIESVLMPYDDGRRTACISTQVGCAQGCVFCATGQMGFKRHLTSAEIFEQAARYSAHLQRKGERLSSVVLLGMGEPLANYNNVLEAVNRIHDELGIGRRRITISTVGLVPEIRRLADERLPITLAISLHAATDEERDALLPVNRRYPIKDLMEAANYYGQTTGRRVSFEWTLIAGNNDDEKTAHKLGRLISQGAPGSHVNLIPLNPTKGYEGAPTRREDVSRFISILEGYSIEATVRVRRGIDIDAGCGQLAERAKEEYDELNERAEALQLESGLAVAAALEDTPDVAAAPGSAGEAAELPAQAVEAAAAPSADAGGPDEPGAPAAGADAGAAAASDEPKIYPHPSADTGTAAEAGGRWA